MSIKHEIVTITPEMAEKFLDRNDVNRPLKGAAIKRYAEDMEKGRWIVGGSMIVQREDGMLLDGQNRLHACIDAGVPFETLLVTGVNGKTLDTIDTGVPRSLGDQLHWRGISNSNAVASAVKWAFWYDDMVENNFRQLATSQPARFDWIEYFNLYEKFFISANSRIISLRRNLPRGSQSIPMFGHVLIARVKGTEVADRFWEEVAFTTEENAAMLLKNWLLDRQGVYKRAPQKVIAAVTIKAERLWLDGRSPKTLLWKRTTRRGGEIFPRIVSEHEPNE